MPVLKMRHFAMAVDTLFQETKPTLYLGPPLPFGAYFRASPSSFSISPMLALGYILMHASGTGK